MAPLETTTRPVRINRLRRTVMFVGVFLVVATPIGSAGGTTYPFQITIPGATSGTVNVRTGPGTNYGIAYTLSDGSSIQIACQISGTDVDGTSVWDQLGDGNYVSDYYATTPVPYGFSPPIPLCSAPSTPTTPPTPPPTAPSSPSPSTYQITIPGATSGTVNERSGPGTNYSLAGTIADGASIVIACQTSGTDVDGTSVWDEINTSVYVSDYYTNTPTPYGFTSSIPQCTSVPTPPPSPTAPSSPSPATYQITIPGATSGAVNERSGPGTNYSLAGTIADGASIVIACQASGTSVGGTTVWDQIASGIFVSDYYTDTPTVDGFTASVPRCSTTPPVNPPTSTPPTPSAPSGGFLTSRSSIVSSATSHPVGVTYPARNAGTAPQVNADFGQCFSFVAQVLYDASSGKIRLDNANTLGYTNVYTQSSVRGARVNLTQAQPGDVIQITGGNGPHTMIIIKDLGGNGFRVIDQNFVGRLNPGIVGEHSIYLGPPPYPQGWGMEKIWGATSQYQIWQIGS
jgi:uncharacterized protein YraI